MALHIYLDIILVPLSLVLTIGYHSYLWYCFKNKPHLTTIGLNTLRRRMWAQSIIEDHDEKKGMLAVQSLRNFQMGSILAAAITVLLISSLAAITNNTYNASHLFKDSYFGSQSFFTLVLKYGLQYILLVFGFLYSSLAVGCFVEVNFFMNATDFSSEYIQAMVERGFLFAFIGNRALYITLPMLLWMFGPVPMALSSVAQVWLLHELDFVVNGLKK
ncbi:Protein of unknown function DUF599 [Macleaya cordata]|uniref:DUF599 domain-containing protein n=1 Tax=Macleaya cordata TaxID=56857 RepID=A0A200Q6N0_MACCD|nr:Protein of unknown function DUF599 [Macleaya cordata]